ncbi:hypothetical protein AK830_g8620 [Neonectria ditissima]|uniref:Zn(2)-C6 fungal-type domain-containing protein n=1 Tax=Neonectria ditissima TaxID=78410 RepID=A0A0P7B7L8_9HYPO|nr:hypothetical protein AK830_g8620 [Neonectria ditissima]
MEGNSTSSSAAKPRGRIENVGPSLCPNSVPGYTPLAHQKQACLPCQSRKVKCDGNGSVCSQCSKRGLHCAYKQRRTRGLGKGKEHVRELEERLEKLEQFLRAQGGARGEDAGSDDARRESPQTTSDKNSPLPIGMPPPRVESPNAMPSTTTPQPPQTTKPPGFIRLPELSRLPRSTYMEMITRSSNTGGFPMKVFIPLHPQADLVGLVASTAEEVGDTYPLFTPGYVKALTDQVVNSSQDNPAYEPTLLAISSSLVAIGVQWKAENSSLAQLSPMMWSHFKNAFAMLPYLMTKGPSVLSFHALVLMAVFLQGSAEMRLATHLIASAVRVAQMAGFPIRNQGHSVPAELNLRAFWTMCTLDVEISNRLMILPTIDDHHLPLTLPSQQPLEPMTGSTEEQVRILSFQAGLATTRSKIHKKYLLHTNQPRVSLVDIEPLDRFEEQLELWAHSLPPDFKPLGIDHRSPKQLPLSIILLQSQYYHSRCTLSTLRAALQNVDPKHTTPLPADVSSARATIRLLSAISAEQEQFCCIW